MSAATVTDAAPAQSQRLTAEARYVLYGILCAIIVIIAVAVFAPADQEDDPLPSTYNAGPAGAKAAYLLLPRLGYRVDRSSDAIALLPRLDAMRTTLVIATPFGTGSDAATHSLESFLDRGGRVLAVGNYGADVLPGQYWKDFKNSGDGRRCHTEPEGASALAMAGRLSFPGTGLLARTDLPETHVAQRCPDGAAVIWYKVGRGTVVWWAGDQPLTNLGLHTDGNLALLLASLGSADRTVLFDESDTAYVPPSAWSKTAGLPLTAVVLQLLLALLFAVLAFGRRHGPLRTLNTTPRTSPLEFAESMGALYHRAGAGEAATQQARRSFFAFLLRQCGVPPEILRGPADGVASDLQQRFGVHYPELGQLLASTGESARTTPGHALTMVRSLHRLTDDLRRRTRRGTSPGATQPPTDIDSGEQP